MARAVLLDPGINLDELEGTGVLLGSYLPSQLLGVYVAPTPADPESAQEEKGEELDVGWMLEHAKQILRMLPGGVYVAGFIMNASPDVLSSKASRIKKLMTGLRGLEQMLDETVFLVSQGRKGVSHRGDELKNIDYKVAEASIEHVQLDTNVILDIPIALASDQDHQQMIFSHAEKGVSKFERCLSTSVCLLNSALRKESELISPPQFDKKKTKHRTEEEDTATEYSVTILVKDDPNVDDDVSIEPNNIRIKLVGKLKSRAYVPQGSRVGDCKEAILQDIMRSLRGRVIMHCDSLVGAETGEGESGEGPIVHEPPRRVLTKLPNTQIAVSDYLYPGELGEDSIESIKELFGFSPQEEDIEDDLELLAAPKDVKITDPKETGREKRAVGVLMVAGSIVVAAASMLLAWYRYSPSSQEEVGEQ